MKLSELTRAHEWWDFKTPQVLSLAYATAIIEHKSLYNLLSPAFLIIFTSLIFAAVYASIINDLTDLEVDLACGKSNMMQNLRPRTQWALTILSFFLVLATAFFIYPDIYSVVFYLLIIVSISLYSFYPVRLKKRGIWGIISCAAAEHLFPVLYVISVIFYFSHSHINFIWLISAGILSFLYGIRSILWHQFLDKENDLKSKINTFVSRVDHGAFKSKSIIIISIELLALCIVLYYLNLFISILFLLLYIIFIIMRRIEMKSHVVIIISPKNEQFQILMLDYYALFFPLSLLAYVAWSQPMGWLVLIIHIVLFHTMLKVVLKESFYMAMHVMKKLWT